MKNKKTSTQHKPLIFIAEDIPKNLQVLCNILSKENYRIAAASNGRQALDMIPLAKPDLILLDVMMPEMNGFDVCEKLRSYKNLRDIPIIFLTAKTEKSDVIKGLELGAVDYLTKPFNGAELLSRVKSHLELKFAREALKELNATKDKFLSIIAHDLKDPLQCSLLYADALHHSYHSLEEEKKQDYIAKVHNSIQQISNLLQNLLTWSASQQGAIQSCPEQLNIGSLTAENILLFNEIAAKKHIELISRINESLPAYADKHMVRTVIRNLMANAVKFTESGGTVTVEGVPRKDTLGNVTQIEISIIDTGVGIAPEDIDGLFRIGVPKSKVGTHNEKGTGLGLILCKEFVERNGGTISVESKIGEGTTFRFTLPVPG